jgi:hypothetical protein
VTELITPEEAEKQGISGAPIAVGATLGETFKNLYDLKGSNVHGFVDCHNGVFICSGVVLPKPIPPNGKFVLAEYTAPLLGFYNAAPGVICAAYGKPVLGKARNVYAGSTVGACAVEGAAYYDTVVLHFESDFVPKEPGAL